MMQQQKVSREMAQAADIQETANILMVQKAMKAGDIADLRSQLADMTDSRNAALKEIEELKSELMKRGWREPSESSDGGKQ